ncbi:glycosyltransferase [Psychroserpens burtonensis]|uniref:glycosyltransferase n=1 Tax=Psychroserpens burtonensis TaxID=49278 RepID=UPI000560B29E|nr:glycosyltransferase [Psychroserpens burtonensis]
MSTLTIISHTEHYKTQDGTFVGLGSTVTEINHLLAVFDHIVHVAMLHDTAAPLSAMPYTSNRIRFVALPALGGQGIKDKLAIVWRAPTVLKIINSEINKTDYFQFRAPTGIGVFVMPYLLLFSSKKGWFKYAGNWKQDNAPLAYSFQRWLLKNQKRKVTINGFWEDQPPQCLSFENPCLTSEELKKGQETRKHKSLEGQDISLCFVGRLEREKGLDLFIEALLSLTTAEASKLKAIHIVGDGNDLEHYLNKTKRSELHFIFHGFLSRTEVHAIYKQSHAIVLPSASEGFPKVISEAMNYGCLPIVSNLSSIAQYISEDVNGFLLYPITLENLVTQIRKLLNLSTESYLNMIHSREDQFLKFTYTHYNDRLKYELLSNY